MDRTLSDISITEFILEIGKYYKDAEPFNLDYIKYWLEDKNMTGTELFRFYWFVIDSHKAKGLPTMGKINDYYEEFSPPTKRGGVSKITQHNRAMRGLWVGFPNEKIIETLIKIKQQSTSEYGVSEISFLAKYSDMYTEMRILQEMNFGKKEIAERVNNIRQAIEDNEKYDLTKRSVSLPELEPKRV